MAATENKPWWSPIVITLVGFIILLFTNPAGWVPPILLSIANFILGLFLILLILIQRGKGGGLAGAFGGVGGSSPFGSRAGDAFTRYTITVATLWLWLIILQVKVIQERSYQSAQGQAAVASQEE